jgi:hypothetical protein
VAQVAVAAVFLASDETAAITGILVSVASGDAALDDPGVGTVAAVDQVPADLGDRLSDRAGQPVRGKTRPGR